MTDRPNPPSICMTEDDVLAVLQWFAERHASECSFRMTSGLRGWITRDSYMKDVFSRTGMAGWNCSFPGDDVCALHNVTWLEHFRYCRTADDVTAFFRECAAKCHPCFSVYYGGATQDTFDRVMRPLLLQSGVLAWSISHTGHRFTFSNVTYAPGTVSCSDLATLETFLRRCGDQLLSSFSFYVSSPAEDLDYSSAICPRLYRAGFKTWNILRQGNLFLVTNAIAYPAFRVCATLAEVKEHVRACTRQLLPAFSFIYPAELTGPMAHFYDLLKNHGFLHGTGSHDEDMHLISVSEVLYRSGFRVACAALDNALSRLTDEERVLHARAQEIVDNARKTSRTPFQLARNLHDYLATHVTYQVGPHPSPNDTACGALLNGFACCGGFSDAYYLLCSLGGLEVAYQRGEAEGPTGKGGHIWNAVRLNRIWRYVDTTWDQLKSVQAPDLCSCLYFNVGWKNMPLHHFVPELTAVPLAPDVDWSWFVYTARPAEGVEAGALTGDPGATVSLWYRQGRKNMHLLLEGHVSFDEMKDMMKRSLSISDIAWNCYLRPFGKYTAVDLFVHPLDKDRKPHPRHFWR